MTTTNNGSRKLWCDLIDHGIAFARKRKQTPTVERLLDSCGIFSWSPYRQRAREYANTMLNPDQKANPDEPTKE
jgi:hypothetical protein